MEIRGASALVTGGCGAVGAAIVNRLIRSEGVARVQVLDRRGGGDGSQFAGLNGAVKVIEADVRYWDDVWPHFEGVDFVFHQAGVGGVAGEDDWRACHEALVGGTLNVARACVEAGVRKLISASSAAVYGVPEILPTLEDCDRRNCATWEGAASVSSEAYLHAFRNAAGLNYVALRYYDVYGDWYPAAGDTPTGMIARWIEWLLWGERPRVFGDGTQTWDLVHVDDVALANVLAARIDSNERVFNVASGNEVSVRDLVKTLLRIMSREDVAPEYLPQRAAVRIPRRWADIRRATRCLRFEPQVSLEEGLRRALTVCESRLGLTEDVPRGDLPEPVSAAEEAAASASRARAAVDALRNAGIRSAEPTASEDAASAPLN